MLLSFTLLAWLPFCISWPAILFNGGFGAQTYAPTATPPGHNVSDAFNLKDLRQYTSVASIADLYYYIGGYIHDVGIVDTTVLFNSRFNATIYGPKLPNPTYAACASSYTATSLIYCGGLSKAGYTAACYKLENNIISQISNYPMPIGYCSMVRIGENVFVFGGLDGRLHTDKVYYYDRSKNWVAARSLPTPTYRLGVAALDDNSAILCGGTNLTSHTTACYKYSVDSNAYNVMAPMYETTGLEYVVVVPPVKQGDNTTVLAFHNGRNLVEKLEKDAWHYLPASESLAFRVYEDGVIYVKNPSF